MSPQLVKVRNDQARILTLINLNPYDPSLIMDAKEVNSKYQELVKLEHN